MFAVNPSDNTALPKYKTHVFSKSFFGSVVTFWETTLY